MAFPPPDPTPWALLNGQPFEVLSIRESDMSVEVSSKAGDACQTPHQAPHPETQQLLHASSFATREDDPNWKTLPLLYEKPGFMAVTTLPTPQPRLFPPRRRSTYPAFEEVHCIVVFVENPSPQAAVPVPMARPRPRRTSVTQRWLNTSMRHEQWWN